MRSLELVGAYHCGVEHGLIFSARTRAHPSQDLIERIKSFPKGTEIGLELPNKKAKLPKFADGYELVSHENNYFKDLRDTCLESELKVIHLDTVGYDEHFKILAEISYLYAQAKKLTDSRAKPSEERIRIAREVYRLERAAEYAKVILRDQGFLKSIVDSTELKIAIVGASHSSHWLLKKLFDEKEIKISSYAEDRTPEVNRYEMDHAIEYGSTIDQIAKLVQDPVLNIEHMAKIEEIERRHLAASKGRICPDRKPDSIGTFDLHVPARGLFEIYINERKQEGKKEHIKGTIEDVFGTAKFHGWFYEDQVFFFKEYFGNALWVGASRRGVRYDGSLYKGKFTGFFTCFTQHGEYKDNFEMEPIN